MKDRSTISQTISYLDQIYYSLDWNLLSLTVNSKCGKLSLVPHNLLLSKLESFGFCPGFLRILDSYLFNRFQSVKIRESFSSLLPFYLGVTQASILGPLLFILFINEMTDIVTNGSYFVFADDLKIDFHESRLIQADLDALIGWSISNGLSFQPSKCKVISFSRIEPDINLKLGSEKLMFVETIEDLGFMVSHNLDWKRHIDSTLPNAPKFSIFYTKTFLFLLQVNERSYYPTH